MRLINADAAEIVEINCFYSDECRLDDVEEWLNEQPTIDAEPVRHGRWKTIAGFMACSECGASPADWEAKSNNPMGLPPYCHSCGAKMDGGADDGT